MKNPYNIPNYSLFIPSRNASKRQFLIAFILLDILTKGKDYSNIKIYTTLL